MSDTQIEITYDWDAETDTWYTADDLPVKKAKKRKRQLQDKVYAEVEQAGGWGLTVWELQRALPDMIHHGIASGALSNLHKQGKIIRTTAKRGGYSVYVVPEWLGDMTGLKQGRDAKVCPNCGHEK